MVDKLYTYDDRNRLTEVTDAIDASRDVTYGFDANGNQTSRTPATGAAVGFVFDVRDRLIRVEEDALPIGSYRYDATGLRISKFTATGEARYVYDDRSVLVRSDDAGTTKFEYGPDRLLSVNHPTDGRAYYLFDALGSVVDLTTPGGSLLAQYQWDAWGNLRSSTDAAANPFGFTGHEMDGESGLIYAKARFYDPMTGRFLSHDPAEGDSSNPPSLHRYLYAFQNPTVFVDPTGRTAEESEERTFIGPEDEVPEGFVVVSDRNGFRLIVKEKEENKPTFAEKLSRWYESKDGLVGQFREGVERAKKGVKQLLGLDKKFDDATGSRPTGATPEEDLLAFQQQREKLGEATGIISEAAEGGVEVVLGAAEAGDAVLTATGQGKLAKEGIELGTKAGARTVSRIVDEGGRLADDAVSASTKKGARVGRAPRDESVLDTARRASRDLLEKNPALFSKFNCKDCRDELKSAFKEVGLKGEVLELQSATSFIYSDKHGLISETGEHFAVRVNNLVFDNLNPNGVPFDEWLSDLGGKEILELGVARLTKDGF